MACPVWTGVHTDEMRPRIGQGLSRFLCAVDAGIRDAPLLKWAAQFAGEQHASLEVVHAVHASAPTPGIESESPCDFLFDVARKNNRETASGGGYKARYPTETGPAGHVVREAALERRLI